MRRFLLAALAGLAMPLGVADAQTPEGAAPSAGRECRLRVQPGGEMAREGTIINVFDPFEVTCEDGAYVRAAAGTVDQVQRVVTLTGDVYFQDATRSLTSDHAVYNSASGMLHATGNVVFTDRVEGTTLSGPELEYYRATEDRPQALVNAYGRPRLTMQRLPTARDSAQADSVREQPAARDAVETDSAVPVRFPPGRGGAPADTSGMPLTIDADRMSILGENDLTAVGNVVIQDDQMRAVADEAEQRGSSETLELRGNASIHSAEYSLEAAVIFATIPGGAIREVEARRDARLIGDDLNVEAPQLNLLFEDDLLQRTVARSDPAIAPGVRPLATSPAFRLEADSLDASLPGQKLELVVAIGNARGEMIDTTRAPVVPVRFPGDTLAADTLAADTLGLPPDSAGIAQGQRPVGQPSADTLALGEPAPAADSAARARADTAALADRQRGGVEAMFASGDSVVTVSAERLVQNDWITGDTITGYFTTIVESPADSVEAADMAGAATDAEENGEASDPLVVGEPVRATPAGADTALVMERLVSVGNARSLYHVPPQEGDSVDARPGINFLSAARIELIFAEGRVKTADVTGLRRGLYLEPMTAADSARAAEAADEAEAAEGQAEGQEPADDDGGADMPPDTGEFPPETDEFPPEPEEFPDEPFGEPDPGMVPEPFTEPEP